jgi:hypothetical protein
MTRARLKIIRRGKKPERGVNAACRDGATGRNYWKAAQVRATAEQLQHLEALAGLFKEAFECIGFSRGSRGGQLPEICGLRLLQAVALVGHVPQVGPGPQRHH